jgi:8-oxo-dGTP diphosphatase
MVAGPASTRLANEREPPGSDRFRDEGGAGSAPTGSGSTPTADEATYCPRCGTQTDTKVIDGRDRCWCPECDVVHWRAAVPVIGVAVVEGDRVLGFYHDRTGLWDLPSGHQELPSEDGERGLESAPETAARELEEETNLAVDPGDLEVFDVTVKRHPVGQYNFSTTYVASAEATTGDLAPEFESDEVAWFTPGEARARDDEFVPGVVPVIEPAVEHVDG